MPPRGYYTFYYEHKTFITIYSSRRQWIGKFWYIYIYYLFLLNNSQCHDSCIYYFQVCNSNFVSNNGKTLIVCNNFHILHLSNYLFIGLYVSIIKCQVTTNRLTDISKVGLSLSVFSKCNIILLYKEIDSGQILDSIINYDFFSILLIFGTKLNYDTFRPWKLAT